MCGYAGVFSFNTPLDNNYYFDILNRMSGSLNHRGPDDRDTKVIGNCALTHARLNIIDLTIAGRQPMSNHDDTVWIAYNGEVYNYKEIRNKLKKFRYFTFCS